MVEEIDTTETVQKVEEVGEAWEEGLGEVGVETKVDSTTTEVGLKKTEVEDIGAVIEVVKVVTKTFRKTG